MVPHISLAPFQSTHPGGVRPGTGRVNGTALIEFQSTHPGGVRHSNIGFCSNFRKISIHAPGWGATSQDQHLCYKVYRFQSTHPGGVRRMACGLFWFCRAFQSTHPGGVRPRNTPIKRTSIDFNPRTRVGCDWESGLRRPHRMISIHAPGWGATPFLV